MRIVFYGTPEFAVPSLSKIIEKGYEVAAVVTAPDKPAGRGLKPRFSAVKEFATEHHLKVLQPVNLRDPEFYEEIKRLNPDLQVIIAFRMLPESIWKLPVLGTLNLHASLLPDYRGAAPINRAIMNGEKKTGLSTFLLQHQIDTGDLLLQKEVNIAEDDDAGSLHDRMKILGAGLVADTLKELEAGTLRPVPQIRLATHHDAPKLYKADLEIDWNQPVIKIHNQVRGLSPYPGAFTYYRQKLLKIFKGHYADGHTSAPGTSELVDGRQIRFQASDGWYYPEFVQPEGRKKMSIGEFVNGLK